MLGLLLMWRVGLICSVDLAGSLAVKDLAGFGSAAVESILLSLLLWGGDAVNVVCMKPSTYVHVHTFLSTYHTDADLEMFGSSANGFGSKLSDLDICLTLPGHDKVHTHLTCVATCIYL